MLSEVFAPILGIIFIIIYRSCNCEDVCLPNSYKSEILTSFKNSTLRSINPDEPLFLTPYLQRGDIKEARRLARVSLTKNLLQINSYAGFLTVNDLYNSNHYFWYFPPIIPKATASLIVWLAGGPGASSISGIFAENGPFRITERALTKMNYTLVEEHHVIYIDNPVGAGFSFTEHMAGYCTDQTQIGEQLYSSVQQFLTLFPEVNERPLYIATVSYGGKYASSLAYTIHQKNRQANVKLNLKGVIIGNGLTDPVNQIQYGDYFYQLGLIDWHQKKTFSQFEEMITRSIRKERWNDAFDLLDVLLLGTVTNVPSIFQNITGIRSHKNYLMMMNEGISEGFFSLLPVMRESLHIGNLPFGSKVGLMREILKQDIMKSVAPWIARLLEHYRILIYNGQLDIIVPYPLTVNYLSKLNFTGAEEYKIAERHIWRVDGEVAGYKKKAGNLVEALVRNAGHAAATEQPKWVLNLVSDFINGNI